ncbi:MAG: Gfo/Idh/MocA family oxidoreductase [Gemmatimonadetes bacterium]|nr:Gfo/Idh/MocA family oxidoreductase [Gemmatimonadota bacterium]MCY3676622.1 Gfo/Idh/MocA family oxidoreductase [Gemmatimonadota bacterium]
MSDKITRRDFVDHGSKLAMGAMIVPRHVLGGPGYQAPSDRLNIAIIGVGGQGTENAQEFGTEHIAAICDVDFGVVHRRVQERMTDGDGNPREKGHRWRDQFFEARQYTDFRELLDREDDLDAVLVATPDHLHAPIAKAAMEAGKHIFVEKPLTYTVHEARALAEMAQRTGVVTQMGNQGHSGDSARLVNEWVQAGVIGDVTEVHIWTNRPIWPQGIHRPEPWEDGLNPGWYQQWHQGAILSVAADVMDAGYAVPEGMDWDLYLGPTTKDIPYHPVYHPFNWRGWVDFGVSALGDMGAHLVDHPYWALGLTYPTTIEATSTPWGGPQDDPASFPLAMRAHYEFPARGSMPAVDLHWYDGGLMPPRPAALPDDVDLNRTGGVMFVGDRGILMHGTYGRNPRLFPESLAAEAAEVPQTQPRIEETHQMNWVKACKEGGEASCPFDYASRLTEVMLLGIVALRTGQGKKIHYDSDAMRITNVEEANRYLTREYRAGWEV